eukprot:COSAG01_NODE_5661_length_4108_cov_3.674390_3_plen_89_part_00
MMIYDGAGRGACHMKGHQAEAGAATAQRAVEAAAAAAGKLEEAETTHAAASPLLLPPGAGTYMCPPVDEASGAGHAYMYRQVIMRAAA